MLAPVSVCVCHAPVLYCTDRAGFFRTGFPSTYAWSPIYRYPWLMLHCVFGNFVVVGHKILMLWLFCFMPLACRTHALVTSLAKGRPKPAVYGWDLPGTGRPVKMRRRRAEVDEAGRGKQSCPDIEDRNCLARSKTLNNITTRYDMK